MKVSNFNLEVVNTYKNNSFIDFLETYVVYLSQDCTFNTNKFTMFTIVIAHTKKIIKMERKHRLFFNVFNPYIS